MAEPDVTFASIDPAGGERFQLLRRELGLGALSVLALGGAGEHQGRDGRAWTSWDEGGPGRSPQEVPLPDDLPG
jgi:hypothetical protein